MKPLAIIGLSVPTGVLAVFFYVPLVFLVLKASQVSLGSFLADSYFRHVLFFTFEQAFLSAALSAVVGTLGAVLYSEAGKSRGFWAALSLVPFSTPPILMALGLVGVWGRQGWMSVFLGEGWEGIYGWAGILIAHTLFNFPLFLRSVGQALLQSDRAEEKAALSLGASRLRCFFEITWPRIRPPFFSAFLLSFLFCTSSFLIVLLLGGGPRFTSIEVAIFQSLRQSADLGTAVGLAWIQILAAIPLSVWIFRKSKASTGTVYRSTAVYAIRSLAHRRLVQASCAVLLLLFFALPLLAVLVRGLGKVNSVDFSIFQASLGLALAAGAFSSFLALCLEYGVRHLGWRWLQSAASVACTLPLAVSSLLLILAWRLFYANALVASSGLWWGVVGVQALMALPVVYRPIQDGFDRIPSSWYRVCASLGGRPLSTLVKMELPALRHALALAFSLGTVLALGEAGAVLLFLDDSTMNLTYSIYQNMGRYRFDEAYGAGAVLLVVTALFSAAVVYLERESV